MSLSSFIIKQRQILFSWSPKWLWTMTAVLKWKDTCSLEEKLWQTRQPIKKQVYHFAYKGPYSQSYGFSSSHVCIWEWTIKKDENWCFWTVVLEKILESLLDCKETKLVNPKRNQSWIFIGRTDAEAPILWPHNEKSWLISKDPDAGKDWGQEDKGTTEDEMVGYHHWFNGYEFEQTPGDTEGQGSLVCCSPWGPKELDTTEWLNNNNEI